MQDIHSIPGAGGGRLLSSSTSTTTTTTIADRRLRSPHHHLNPQSSALNCPRCDSLNTKFCYYNNYNLSQPRHFCKSCRRYWTKGGVLRNVPFGGGCRKTKRSKPKPIPPLSSSDDILPLPPPPPPSTSSPAREVKKSSSHSSSDSSTLTAITAASTATEAVSSTGSLMSFQFSKNPHNTPGFEANLVENHTDEDGVLVNMESLTGLMRTSSEQEQLQLQLPFDGSYNRFLEHEENQWNQPQEIITSNSVHVEVDLPVLGSRLGGENGGEFGPLNYDDQDQGLFDQLTSGVDQAYWNQLHYWNDGQHPTLYFLP